MTGRELVAWCSSLGGLAASAVMAVALLVAPAPSHSVARGPAPAKPVQPAPIRTAADVARALAPLKHWPCGRIDGPKGRIVSTCYSDRKASHDLLIQLTAFSPKPPAA
jgi:hypothetical protein